MEQLCNKAGILALSREAYDKLKHSDITYEAYNRIWLTGYKAAIKQMKYGVDMVLVALVEMEDEDTHEQT